MKYHLDALEFNQVLDILGNYAKTDYAKELIYDLMKKFGAEQMDIDFVNYSEKYPYEDKNEMDKEECNKLYKYFCEQRENSK